MVEIKIVSKSAGEYMGAHNPAEDPPLIWMNAKTIWDWAAEHSPPRATQDDIEERFIKKFDSVYIQELVCIFKSKDKLRIKGGACNPFCRHEKIVDLLCNPSEWPKVREHHRKKKIKYLES